MDKGSIKSKLSSLDKNQLISLLVDLSKLSKDNSAFLKGKLDSDFNNLFKLSCKKIDFALRSYELMSLKNARQAIKDFTKLPNQEILLIKLCFYYIDLAYDLEKTDWRFQENFYSAIEKTYDVIFNILKNNYPLKEEFKEDLLKRINLANDGWGHKDYLKERFSEIFTKSHYIP